MCGETAVDFGARIRQLRQDMKMSQKLLAQRLGISPETMYRYENNLQTPSLERTIQLANILNTSIDYLVGRDSQNMIRLPNLPERKRRILVDFIQNMFDE